MKLETGSDVYQEIGKILEEAFVIPSEETLKKCSTAEVIILTNQINIMRLLGKMTKLIWLESK